MTSGSVIAVPGRAGMYEFAEALTSGLWPSADVLPAAECRQQGRRLELQPLVFEPG